MIVKTTKADKWISKVHPADPIGVAARETLKLRLQVVIRLLKLSAKRWRDDVEYVHQLRVHTRRCLAAIEMYWDVLPKRERKRLKKWLVKVRRAAGEARDMDVLLAKYQQTSQKVWPLELASNDSRKTIRQCRKMICRQIKKRRRRAQNPIRRLHDRLVVSGRIHKCVKRLLRSIPKHPFPDQPSFERWAQKRFAVAVERFVAAIPVLDGSLSEWHRFRIRGKQLRYTMELVAVVYDRGFRTELYSSVSQLQDKLGEMLDHAAASRHLTAFRQRLQKGRKAEFVEAMITREQEQFEVTRVEVQGWWIANAGTELQPLLDRYTQAWPAEVPHLLTVQSKPH